MQNNRDRDLSSVERMIGRYRGTMRLCEDAYGIKSEDAVEAINRGRLRQTLEVCSWLLAIDAHERLTGSRALPAEYIELFAS